ncbi:hypothetical protein EV363DRAFT_1156260 [Boletus edulis]|uniref:RING-type domain-containing protein n=2 Tax=Boletus edulis BED1 TaxID=1328754 RepID=A0AAD4BAI4_BOLED|nr:hypothetical protein EV363DRAFT_1405129 [Boletus edulis]KAF8137662.1 hypothetical protein EV363DRAFT_1156260 [Boletus edulis]KAF8414776.1 hypothetical protein L210DRAFT_3433825 [Boletus edulis BED1]
MPSPDKDADVGSLLEDDPSPSCLVGKVELVRRRVTRDGRVKLKMILFGVAVEKCAICMTQFKGDDVGILGATCHHAFHETCLATWLDRSQTCPLCRERLGVC